MGGGARHPHSRIKSHSVSFPAVAKSVPFAPVFASKANFLEMGAEIVDLPVTSVAKLKHATPAVQLTYGYRKGGIGCVYQMSKQPGVDARAAFEETLASGIFKDRRYFKEWVIKSVLDKNLLIAVSGTTPEVQSQLVKAIGR